MRSLQFRFYVSKRSKQRFCSPECQHEWQIGNTGFKNPKFEGGYVKCDTCGKEYLVGKYKLEQNQHHFCSAKCRQEWYANVWSQTDEWKEASRQRAVKILSENSVITLTKPQSAVNDILDSLEIAYKNEEPFVYYAVDNYLIDLNLIIEVMGDYWHGSPLKYSDGLNEKQAKVVTRDKAKRTFIKKYYDISVLYIWEYDALKRPDVCAALIREYINNGGTLYNYNSFNYYLNENGQLQLKDEIIYPYQEREIAS